MKVKLPEAVGAQLRALETRLLAVLALFGAGRVLIRACLLLLALYAVDRLFEPPPPVRWVLSCAALGLLARDLWRFLWVPLRRRPAQRDFAALWERSHPALAGLFSAAVELQEIPPGSSPALVARVAEQAAAAAPALQARKAVLGGRARRSALLGCGGAAALALLTVLLPGEASVFWNRLFGGAAAWPKNTRLVLLPARVEGQDAAPPWREEGSEEYRLVVAQGSVVSLRLRVEGIVPERVEARAPGGELRLLRPLGGGEFVLRLAPLEESLELSLRGGDDQDGRPRVSLDPGVAPRVVDWTVRIEPPAYTGRAAEESAMNEFQVPEGTRLGARFRADQPGARAFLRDLEGGERELIAGAGQSWEIATVAEQSGELVVALEGGDGFRDGRAAVLRWQALPDRPPKLQFLFPEASWGTVAEGAVPFLVEASDDYGLDAVSLGFGGGPPSLLAEAAGRGQFRHFQVLPSSALAAAEPSGTATARFRGEATARDAASPEPQQSAASSSWIEILSREEFERRGRDHVAEARDLVERALERLADLLAETSVDPAAVTVRRLRRDLDGLVLLLEQSLIERLYADLDSGSAAARQVLDGYLPDAPFPAGGAVAALAAARSTRPLDRSGLLYDLARAALNAREGALEELAQAVARDQPPQGPAERLQAQLASMLEIMTGWEDLQSAIELLRGLLDRQRALHLRTQDLTDR